MNSNNQERPKKIAYLCGSPRVSTRPEAEAYAPKSHILGVIRAFQSLGWDVKSYIVGDRVPKEWIQSGSGRKLSSSIFTRIAADLLRVVMGWRNSRDAVSKIGEVDWAYERFGAYQDMGRAFQKKGIPWILETNAPLFKEALVDRRSMQLHQLARKLEYLAYRDCDVLVCVSTALKDIIVSEFNISEKKIIVLPNGVDTSYFDPDRISAVRFFNFPTIGYVGELIDWQSIDVLIKAVAKLKKDGIQYGLVIIGDGRERNNLEELVKLNGLEASTRFLGKVMWEQVPSYLNGFDICYSGHIATSTGFMYFSPLKLYEYMSMGKPVVASSHEESRNLLGDGKGYLFSPGDVYSLAETLQMAATQCSQWPEMGKRIRDEIVLHHSWEARVRELIYFVDKIVKNQSL